MTPAHDLEQSFLDLTLTVTRVYFLQVCPFCNLVQRPSYVIRYVAR